MAELPGQQLPVHDAAPDYAFDQIVDLHFDASFNPSPPRLSFNQTGLPSPFTWKQAFSDDMENFTHCNVSIAQQLSPSNSLENQFHDPGLLPLNMQTLHEHCAPSYDLSSTSEALENASQTNDLATATISSAGGQGIYPQPQAPVHTHHLPALSINDVLSGPFASADTVHAETNGSAVEYSQPLGHNDVGSGLVSYLEIPPSVMSSSAMAYDAETSSQNEATQMQPEQMRHLTEIAPTNPMTNILNTLDATSVAPISALDALPMSESTGNVLHLQTQPSPMSAMPVNFEFAFQLPSVAVTVNFGQNAHAPSATVPAPASSTQYMPDTTEDSRVASRSSTGGPSEKRARIDDDDACQSPRPSTDSPAGERRIPCQWQKVFGGGCIKTFCKGQQADRHILGHLPDTDGTAFFSYLCKKCPAGTSQEGVQTTIKKWGKKEERGFARDDACQRHVKKRHAEVRDPAEHVLEVPRPWWWPCDLLRTKRYKECKIGPKPEGETRDWQRYFQDIISEYPDVINKPLRARGDEENHEEGEGESGESVKCTRPVKRQRTKKDSTPS